MKNLQPIKLLPARERIASVLRRAILTKEIFEGSIIKLDDMATQLGVSHTPVREAFQILAREGLIKLTPNKGAQVLAITPKFIMDHYETRRILESAAAAAVCRNNADTSAIENAYKQGKEALEAHDLFNYTNFNQAFHMAIWEAADNTKIKNLLSELWNGLSMGINVTVKEYTKISIAEHKQILDAILSRDSAAAQARMSEHITRSMNNMLTRFD